MYFVLRPLRIMYSYIPDLQLERFSFEVDPELLVLWVVFFSFFFWFLSVVCQLSLLRISHPIHSGRHQTRISAQFWTKCRAPRSLTERRKDAAIASKQTRKNHLLSPKWWQLLHASPTPALLVRRFCALMAKSVLEASRCCAQSPKKREWKDINRRSLG